MRTLAVLLVLTTAAFAADASNYATRADAWQSNFNSGNLAAVQAMYASDGCRMPPNAETVTGSDAILTQLKATKDLAPKIKLAVTSAQSSGDLAVGIGRYELTTSDGQRHIDHGKWMSYSRKVNGTWKIQCDIFNSDMAASAPAH
jgi:ketosteroid isomerase-like protein